MNDDQYTGKEEVLGTEGYLRSASPVEPLHAANNTDQVTGASGTTQQGWQGDEGPPGEFYGEKRSGSAFVNKGDGGTIIGDARR